MLIRTVESFLRRHAMSASQFGRDAAQDPRLVADLRAGREPRPPLDQRVRGFIEGYEVAHRLRGANRRASSRPHARPETGHAR